MRFEKLIPPWTHHPSLSERIPEAYDSRTTLNKKLPLKAKNATEISYVLHGYLKLIH